MQFRSILFVPGDRPDRFAKAMNSEADALILDLEDSVAPSQKPIAREHVAAFLSQRKDKPVYVRLNPISSGLLQTDLDAVNSISPDGVVLPKSESAADIEHVVALMGARVVPILPIATETPRAIFGLGSYVEVAEHLVGLTWGAEDLPAAIGATTSREADGTYTPPYEYARSIMLFAAHAAGVSAIETVFPDIKNMDGLADYAARGRRDGFTAMMAIHPAQCPVINKAFTPSQEEIAAAQKIVETFERSPEAGVFQVDGKMVDAPHLAQARKLLERSKAFSG